MTINYGAIVSENVVDQSFDLFPAGSQDLLKQRVPEKDKDFLFGFGSKAKLDWLHSSKSLL